MHNKKPGSSAKSWNVTDSFRVEDMFQGVRSTEGVSISTTPPVGEAVEIALHALSSQNHLTKRSNRKDRNS